jgi:hypothetical protein
MNKWIVHVKKYAKKHNCSYKDALKLSKATYLPYLLGGSEGGIRGSDIIYDPPFKISKAKPATPVHASFMADPFQQMATAQGYFLEDPNVDQLSDLIINKILREGFPQHVAIGFINYWYESGRDVTQILDMNRITLRREIDNFRSVRTTEL